jgi:hypothetical protein
MSNIRLQCVDGNGTPVFLVNESGIVTGSTAQLSNANMTTQTVGTSLITTSIIATGNNNTIGGLIITGGNIGIGTTAPSSSARLDVDAATETSGALIAQFGGSRLPRIQLYDSSATSGPKIFFNHGYTGVIEAVGNIVFLPTGNVGISTMTPEYTLDSNGTISVRNGNSNAGAENKTQIAMGWNNSNTYTHSIQTRHDAGQNNSGNAINFYVWQTSNSVGQLGTKNIMNITSQGVGIDTLTPSGTLHAKSQSGYATVTIDSTTAAASLLEFYNGVGRTSAIYRPGGSNQLRIYMDSPGFDVMTFATGGNIGIYNGAPSATLDIATSNTFGQLFLGNSVQNRKLVLYNAGNNDHQFYGFGINTGTLRYQVPTTDDNHIFYAGTSSTSSNELMRIRGNGNVGIGTNDPSFKLQVSGDIAIPYGNAIRTTGVTNTKLMEVVYTGSDQTRIYAPGNSSGSDTPKISIENNGRVGINTTSPAQQLDVRGDAIMGLGPGGLAVVNTLTNYNVTFGSAMGMTMGQGNQWSRMYTTNVNANTNRFTIDMTANNSTYTSVLTATNNSAGTIYVGIGTSSPQYTLDVGGHVNISSYVNRTITGGIGYLYYGGWIGVWGDITADYSLYASHRVAATEFNSYSDQRIKKDIQDINDDSALQTIRAIEPKRYTYIDKVSRGDKPVWGFIAQQVASVLDYSTNKIQSYIPNVYKRVTVTHNTGGSILSSDLLDTDTFDLTNTDEIDREGNAKLLRIRIFVDKGEQDSMLEVFVKQIISKTEIQIEDVLDEDITEAFFYGQRVNNFHTLNKDAIFTVSVAALQEVDRQLYSAKQKIIERQQKIDTLNAQIQDILSRIVSI